MNITLLRLIQAALLSLLASFPFLTFADTQTNSTTASSDVTAQQLFDRGAALIAEQQVADGINWLKKAAEQGHAQAAFELASLYETGLGVDKNYQTAKGYYEKAVAKGHRDAHYNLALLLSNEQAPFSDLERSRDLMSIIADRGDADAQFALVNLFNDSLENVDTNPAEALRWLKRAASGGHGKAQFQLGVHYLKGDQMPEDASAALVWFKKAAAQNVSGAHFNLALMYKRGDGVPVNTETALKWYESAAALGNANAQQNLGIKYLLGENIKPDTARAVGLITSAAQSGLRNSQFLLGRLYQFGYQGKIGIDLSKAEHWYLLAAKQGQPDAQFQLATILLEKRNRPDDAAFWIEQAVAAGHKEAIKLQAEL